MISSLFEQAQISLHRGGRSGGDYYSDSINFWYKATAPPSTAADIETYVHVHNMRFGRELAKAPAKST